VCIPQAQLRPIGLAQGGFKNLQNRSRRRQSAHFSSIIGVLAPTAVGGYDFAGYRIRPALDSRRADRSCRAPFLRPFSASGQRR